MYCRNCANEVNDKAVACPKCGVNPRTEKSFCPSCAAPTSAEQVACPSCGVALGSKPFNIDTSQIPQVEVKNLFKGKNAKILLVGVVLAIAVYAYLQYAKHLSRGKAEDLIVERLKLPTPIKYLVQYGNINFGWGDHSTLNEYAELARLNIIRLVEKEQGWGEKTYEIGLTEEGMKYKIADSSGNNGAQFHILKVADKEFGEIKSIREFDGAKEAEVVYTLVYKNQTPVAKALLGSEGQNINEPKEQTVRFFKSDNGWEIYGRKNIVKDVWDELQDMRRGY